MATTVNTPTDIQVKAEDTRKPWCQHSLSKLDYTKTEAGGSGPGAADFGIYS